MNTDATSLYGLAVMRLTFTFANNGLSTGWVGRCYYINGAQNCVVVTNDDTTYTPVANSNIHGTTDTLTVDANGAFRVNGHLLDNTTFTTPLDGCNAIGIIAGADSKVDATGVRVGQQTISPITYKPNDIKYNKHPSYILGGTGLIVDMAGRTVGRVSGDIRSRMRDLPNGVYCIIENKGTSGEIRHAIVSTH